MKRVRIELYRSAQYSWMASSVSEEAVSALSLAYKTAACVKTMPNLRAFLARALRASAPRLPYMMRNSRTSAQTKDFSVKTMELTRVRKALMNPWSSRRQWSLDFKRLVMRAIRVSRTKRVMRTMRMTRRFDRLCTPPGVSPLAKAEAVALRKLPGHHSKHGYRDLAVNILNLFSEVYSLS